MNSTTVNLYIWCCILSLIPWPGYVPFAHADMESTTQAAVVRTGVQPSILPQGAFERSSSTEGNFLSAQTQQTVPRKPPYDPTTLVDVVMPKTSLQIGQEYDLHLKFKEKDLKMLLIEQKVWYDDKYAETVQGSEQSPTLMHDERGDPYIPITPLRLGPVEFFLRGFFSNGKFFTKIIKVNVVESSVAPTRLVIGRPRFPNAIISSSAISLESWGNKESPGLIPTAYFDGISDPIKIDPQSVHYVVRTVDGRDVISINPITGGIRAIRTGSAVVEATYAGVTAKTCIVVVEKDSQVMGTNSHCEDILLGSGRH